MSEQVISRTREPQGNVLSLFLFTLNSSDSQYNSGPCHLQKYSDDVAVIESVTRCQGTECGELVDSFTAWCGNNHFILNMNKVTKKDDCGLQKDQEVSTIHAGRRR